MTNPLRDMDPDVVATDMADSLGITLPPLVRMDKSACLVRANAQLSPLVAMGSFSDACALVNSEEGGGDSAPDWVPEGAKIHIDLVGGDPQGRAWVDGTGEVAADTLLGNDPVVDSAWGGNPSEYTTENLTPYGYTGFNNKRFALIGAARSLFLAGCTAQVRMAETSATGAATIYIGTLSEDGEDEVSMEAPQNFVNVHWYSGGGSLDLQVLDVWTGSEEVVGIKNCVAFTLTDDRIDVAVNGSGPETAALDGTDRPPGNPLVAVAVEPSGAESAIQSITLYDPLPDTDGLSELSEVPEDLSWIPDGAKIHIDLVRAFNSLDAAWVEGTGVVAVDTLLGSDANTENGWSPTAYDPGQLAADGYQGSTDAVAFIGGLRTAILSGATMVVRQKHDTGGIAANPFVAVSADGNAGVFFQLSTEPNEAKVGSYVGDLASIPSIVNSGDAAFNVISFTTTPTRLDYAVNGSSAEAVALTAEDYPASGESQIVAALVDTSSATEYIQSITLYDPLPSTAGLSELSETGVTNTAPTNWSFTNLMDNAVGAAGEKPEGTGSATVLIVLDSVDDAEGNPLTLTIEDDAGGHVWLYDNNNHEVVTGPIQWIPGGIYQIRKSDIDWDVGTYTPVIRVTDPGGLYVEQEFTITVTA